MLVSKHGSELQPYIYGIYFRAHGHDIMFLTAGTGLAFFPSWLGAWLAVRLVSF